MSHSQNSLFSQLFFCPLLPPEKKHFSSFLFSLAEFPPTPTQFAFFIRVADKIVHLCLYFIEIFNNKVELVLDWGFTRNLATMKKNLPQRSQESLTLLKDYRFTAVTVEKTNTQNQMIFCAQIGKSALSLLKFL